MTGCANAPPGRSSSIALLGSAEARSIVTSLSRSGPLVGPRRRPRPAAQSAEEVGETATSRIDSAAATKEVLEIDPGLATARSCSTTSARRPVAVGARLVG